MLYRLLFNTTLITLLLLAACSSPAPQPRESGAIPALDDCPVIAHKIKVGADSVTIVDIQKADSTITLRLTDLAEDIRFVRLQNSNSALVADGMTWVSGNRIVVYTDGVVRQFDMAGRYLGRIGDRGHGPGQYTIAPMDVHVDEEAERIYLVQPGTGRIFMYDANDGSFIRNIPLSYRLDKGRIHVDTENELITVASAPFKYSGRFANVWTQDFRGRVKTSATRRHLAVVPDYSNDVMVGQPVGDAGFDYSVFSITARQDTLYSFRDGKLRPAFSYSWGGKQLPVHEFRSTPDLFALVLLANPKHTNKSLDSIPALTPLVVDRKSLRGNFANLMLDNIGSVTIKTNWLQQSTPENFVMTFVPMELYDLIKEAPEHHQYVTPEAIKMMYQLRDSIHPADNNYVLIARWKNPASN